MKKGDAGQKIKVERKKQTTESKNIKTNNSFSSVLVCTGKTKASAQQTSEIKAKTKEKSRKDSSCHTFMH
jgi:hypothetical protein